jgi:Protein of unknown function (DUF4236)
MGWFFRTSKKIAPGVRLNVSKGVLGMSSGVRAVRLSTTTQRETYVSGAFGGAPFRERLRKGDAGRGVSPAHAKQARNLEFARFVVEKAETEGLDVISHEWIAKAAEEFFGDVTSPEARAGIAYVNDQG